MFATERQNAIEQRLADAGRVSVIALAREFDVTTETVRRDLDALDRAGILRRVHGGAVAADRGSLAEASVGERGALRNAEKDNIAIRALDAVGRGFRGSIYVDAGTTTAAIARRLPEHLRSAAATVEIVTHALPIASELGRSQDAPVTLIGGRIRGVTAAAVGTATVESIGALRPDVAFIGANGISAAFGLSTPDLEEAHVKHAIVRAARRVIVVADASKLSREFLVRFARLDEIDVLVTDQPVDQEFAQALDAADVEVWT